MRVVTFCSTANEAAEAAYLAGVANQELNNPAAARAAFERVARTYDGSPFATEAVKALTAMHVPVPAKASGEGE